MDPQLEARIAHREQALREIKRILRDALHVPLDDDAIDPDAPLFGTGIGLDSVDALELVVSAEEAFEVQLPEDAMRTGLRTVNTLADLVLALQAAGS